MSGDPRTQLVGRGYDAMIDTWEAWAAQIADDPRHEWCTDLIARLDNGARVLELGCGGGTTETQRLAERFALTGVDLSERQLERARRRVPGATFLNGDMTALAFEPSSFQAVVAFYSFNHVPRVAMWLVSGGFFMTALATGDEEGWYGDFLGAPSFFSGYTPPTNRSLLREGGFELLRDEVVSIEEPGGSVSFHWILGQT